MANDACLTKWGPICVTISIASMWISFRGLTVVTMHPLRETVNERPFNPAPMLRFSQSRVNSEQ